MRKKEKGFTLTEIMIVIVILASMAALALPRMMAQNENAFVAEAVGILSAIRQAEVSYALEHAGAYADFGAIDYDDPSATNNNFDFAIDNTDPAVCLITATRKNASDAFDGTTIILNVDGTWDEANQTHPLAPKN